MNVGDYLAFQTHSKSLGKGRWMIEKTPNDIDCWDKNLRKYKIFEEKYFGDYYESCIDKDYKLLKKASFGWRVKRLKQ